MKPELTIILEDLFKLNPELKQSKPEIIELLEKFMEAQPLPQINTQFVQDLRRTIIATAEEQQAKPSFLTKFFNNFQYVLSGAVITLILAVPLTYQISKNFITPPQILTKSDHKELEISNEELSKEPPTRGRGPQIDTMEALETPLLEPIKTSSIKPSEITRDQNNKTNKPQLDFSKIPPLTQTETIYKKSTLKQENNINFEDLNQSEINKTKIQTVFIETKVSTLITTPQIIQEKVINGLKSQFPNIKIAEISLKSVSKIMINIISKNDSKLEYLVPALKFEIVDSNNMPLTEIVISLIKTPIK